MTTKKSKKIAINYVCELCDYNTFKKADYTKHLNTIKHENNKTTTDNNIKIDTSFQCEICQKKYSDRICLWRHKQKCKKNIQENIVINETHDNTSQNKESSDKELMMLIIKENAELKNMLIQQQNSMMELCKNGIYNNNIINTNNSHNKTFNLNMFLNETCKNAMNISDFVNSIQLQLSDLEDVGELGYVNGISNIIIKNLKELDVTQRPIHCTDAKREILYVKDGDKWEKENEKKERMILFVKNVAGKNIRMLNEFKKKYPDCMKSESNKSDHYNKLIVEAMGGSGFNFNEQHDKIIKRISKEVTINKLVI
jgi:hypothetical protein